MVQNWIQTRLVTIMPVFVIVAWLNAGLVENCIEMKCHADEPRLILNTNGPIGEVQCVRFSKDGNRIFSGGNDKVVRTWDVFRKANGDIERLVQSRKYFWQVARSTNGRVHDLKLSPDGTLLAIAGISAAGRNSDIWIYEANTGKLKTVLTDHQSGRAIYRVCFSPDGKSFASVSLSGEVLLWDTENWKSKVVQADPQTDARFWSISFGGNDALLFPTPFSKRSDGYHNFRITRFSLKNSTSSIVRNCPVHEGVVYAISSDESGKTWLSSDAAGNLFAFSNGAFSKLIRKAKPIREIRVGKSNYFCVGVFNRRFAQDPRFTSSIEQRRLTDHTLVKDHQSKDFKDIWSLDISSDEKYFAIAAQTPNRIAAGKVADVFSDAKMSVASGTASIIQKVGFAVPRLEDLKETQDATDLPNLLNLSFDRTNDVAIQFDLKKTSADSETGRRLCEATRGLEFASCENAKPKSTKISWA